MSSRKAKKRRANEKRNEDRKRRRKSSAFRQGIPERVSYWYGRKRAPMNHERSDRSDRHSDSSSPKETDEIPFRVSRAALSLPTPRALLEAILGRRLSAWIVEVLR